VEPADSTWKLRGFWSALTQVWHVTRKPSTALTLRFDLAQLWQSTAWRAGYFMFRAAPGRNAETGADQNCNRAADATPRSGVSRENQYGD
jgi:hypothetical protein